MNCEKLFEKIDSLNEKYIKIWEDVCNIESPTANKENVDKVGKYFEDMAAEKGWMVEKFCHNVSGDVVCITMNAESSLEPLSFSGHIDTVHPVGLFGSPAVTKDDTKIYGPGVADCKGGVVAAFMAMDALSQCGYTKRPIQLLLQTDEEVGSRFSDKATIGYICEKAKDSVAFINLEGHPAGKAIVERKGIATFKFDVEGIEAHSSNCATAGANAIVDAAQKLLELDKIKDDGGITCNCATIEGGSVVNTVPGHCSFTANFRFVTAKHLDEIRETVKKIASTEHVKGCKCTCTQISSRYAMEKEERNLKLLDTLNLIFEHNGLPALEPAMSHGGSDAADVTVFGIPCVDSLGAEGGCIHSAREYALLDSLAKAAKRLVAIAEEI